MHRWIIFLALALPALNLPLQSQTNFAKSMISQLRDFLRENPDHLDAKADLLKEARRLALEQMPPNIAEDLGAETDLRTWGTLAAETDDVFSGSWIGAGLNFFRPDQSQPERFSKLMKAVFRKHISQVESAVREQPTNAALWNIWAWMARSLPDYKWDAFFNSIEPLVLHQNNLTSPPGDVCAWAIEEFLAKKDWHAVVKYARMARQFNGYLIERKTAWVLSGIGTSYGLYYDRLKNYPIKSAFMPHIEALLRLGNVEEANNVFDDMIRLEGDSAPGIAQMAANVARSAGMEGTAKIWEKGKPVNSVPYYIFPPNKYSPYLLISADVNGVFSAKMTYQTFRLEQISKFYYIEKDDIETLGWRKNDDDRWALISGDGRLLAQDTSVPELEAMKAILYRFDIKSDIERCREHIAKHGNAPGLELFLAFEIIYRNGSKVWNSRRNAGPSSSPHDEVYWDEAVKYLNDAIINHPDAMVYMPIIAIGGDTIKDPMMKSISKKMLSNIESLLHKKPSADALWWQWLFWRGVEGDGRTMVHLVDSIKTSPLSKPGTAPPGFALDEYYQDCKKTGDWPKVIELLKPVWERDYSMVLGSLSEKPDEKLPNPALGDRVGIPLIEAYLNDGKPNGADGIFNAWLEAGCKFSNVAKLLESAKAAGYESLGKEWEKKAGK
jgi:tetratricopeptide (TPR) repeat protein